SFLQNHDAVGNQPFGTRLSMRAADAALHAGIAIVMLSPQIPLLFMGEVWGSESPFLFFCDYEPGVADAVREGRRRQFAHFPECQEATARQNIPNPTLPSTIEQAQHDWAEPTHHPHPGRQAR